MTATMLQSVSQAPPEAAAAAVSGLVELGDGHAFVRTSGYRTGPGDVYVSASQIRQYGLRTGDWVEGTVRLEAGRLESEPAKEPGPGAAASTGRWPGWTRSTGGRPAWPARTSTS